jgi:hypothetical protein
VHHQTFLIKPYAERTGFKVSPSHYKQENELVIKVFLLRLVPYPAAKLDDLTQAVFIYKQLYN